MEQQIRVWPDQLEALFGLLHEAVGNKCRMMARDASRAVEHLLAPEDLRIILVPASRHAQIAAIERHELQ